MPPNRLHRTTGRRGSKWLPASSRVVLAAVALVLGACGDDSSSRYAQQAKAIAEAQLVVDTHIDAPYRLHLRPADLGVDAPDREFDYPRAKSGGLDVAFMSIYTPPSAATDGRARQLADQQIDAMEALAAEQPNAFAIATCTEDVERIRATSAVALALGMENGSPLATSTDPLAGVEHFVGRGIRYVTLAHSRSNEFSDSSYDEDERWQGLSDAGRKLVAALNRHGVMIDISHLSDNAAWQVIELSEAPVIASHSSLRHFVPGFHRNMTDDMAKALAARGGVVQINFGSGFVSTEARSWAEQSGAALLAELGDKPDAEARRTFLRNYREQHPYPFADVDAVLDHIDRVVQLAGVEHVGLGSDFDGVGDTLPNGLKDVADFPNLIEGLLQRGYPEADIAKILGLNLMRVWKQVENHGRKSGFPPMCRQAA